MCVGCFYAERVGAGGAGETSGEIRAPHFTNPSKATSLSLPASVSAELLTAVSNIIGEAGVGQRSCKGLALLRTSRKREYFCEDQPDEHGPLTLFVRTCVRMALPDRIRSSVGPVWFNRPSFCVA